MTETAVVVAAAAALPDDVTSWIEHASGRSIAGARRVPGGNSRQAWFVDLDGPFGVPSGPGKGLAELFLRFDPKVHDDAGTFMSLNHEAEIFRALHGTGVTVPRVLAVHPSRQAVLSERIDGDTWFYRITDIDEQVRVASDFIVNLAALHRLDPAALGLGEVLGPVRTVAEHATEEIRRLRVRSTGRDGAIDPLTSAALDWLECNVPAYDGQTVLVQGDTGPGNFMYRNGKVTAVVDWELAHFGDPMDDIAWLSLRTVQDTFTYLPDRLREYEVLSGIAIDEHRVWYYRLMAEVRLAGLTTRGGGALARAVDDGRDAGNVLIYGLLHRRLLLEAFGHAARFELPAVDVGTPSKSLNEDAFAATLGMLRAVAQRPGDALSSQWVKSAARLVKYLRCADADGRRLADEELAELSLVLDHRCADLPAARAELDALTASGALGSGQYIAHLWRRSQREGWLGRESSGALRTRSWPPLFREAD